MSKRLKDVEIGYRQEAQLAEKKNLQVQKQARLSEDALQELQAEHMLRED